MESPRFKVKWANRHIDRLIADSTPLSRDLYEVVNAPARSTAPLANPDRFELTYRPKQPIGKHFGALVGDAVNNLREALDYWMNNALMAVGNPKKIHFPFVEKWEDLKNSRYYPIIEKAFPEAADFILKNVKPCRDTNLPLWAASSICNFNKHNDFVPVISVVNVENLNARIGTNTLSNCSFGGDANHPIKILSADTPIAVDENFRTVIEIHFPEGVVFEGKPVIPTLKNISETVSETLDALEVFIQPHLKKYR